MPPASGSLNTTSNLTSWSVTFNCPASTNYDLLAITNKNLKVRGLLHGTKAAGLLHTSTNGVIQHHMPARWHTLRSDSYLIVAVRVSQDKSGATPTLSVSRTRTASTPVSGTFTIAYRVSPRYLAPLPAPHPNQFSRRESWGFSVAEVKRSYTCCLLLWLGSGACRATARSLSATTRRPPPSRRPSRHFRVGRPLMWCVCMLSEARGGVAWWILVDIF